MVEACQELPVAFSCMRQGVISDRELSCRAQLFGQPRKSHTICICAPDPFVHERQPRAQSGERELRLDLQHLTNDLGGLVSLAKLRERRCQNPKRGGVAWIFDQGASGQGSGFLKPSSHEASEGHARGSQPPSGIARVQSFSASKQFKSLHRIGRDHRFHPSGIGQRDS